MSYILKGVPTCFADCLDYMSDHPPVKVSVDLQMENVMGGNVIILQLNARFRWVFDDREVDYTESMGGIIEHESEARRRKSVFNANRRLARRKRDFEELGIELASKEEAFKYGEKVPEREDFANVILERFYRSMRDFYRTFPAYRYTGRKILFVLLGLAVFLVVFLLPPWKEAVDPAGEVAVLTRQGKGAIAVFLMALVWWVSEAAPAGVITLSIALFQPLFGIRSSLAAFGDLLDPVVIFIFGSIMLGAAISKTGLSRRLAFGMLRIVGEKTRLILLGVFVITAALAHIMAHTAAAAALFPLFAAILALYEGGDGAAALEARPSRFGKALFIGMAYSAGAGSIVTFLGSARAAAAADIYAQFTGTGVQLYQLSRYLFPVAWIMVVVIWFVMVTIFAPEKKSIAGLKEKVLRGLEQAGTLSRKEWSVLAILISVVAFMMLQSFVPSLRGLDRSAVMMIALLLLFLLKVLDAGDLGAIPWNIVLLVSGAMTLGYGLWETGAAHWIAVKWLAMFHSFGWIVFALSVGVLLLLLTNFIMNVAAVTISLPVSLAIAGYLGINPEIVLFTSLVTSGMPFLLLIGAPPNAIAYSSRQFKASTFFLAGLPVSLVLIGILAFALAVLWPAMGLKP